MTPPKRKRWDEWHLDLTQQHGRQDVMQRFTPRLVRSRCAACKEPLNGPVVEHPEKGIVHARCVLT